MKKGVAKLVIIDHGGKYLMMHRSEHPDFGIDPDLPGGTVEDGESCAEALLREVKEETGIDIAADAVREVYSGADYSKHGTHYVLFVSKLSTRPDIVMSWEHSKYAWLELDEFVDVASKANDTYMHMVADVLNSQTA